MYYLLDTEISQILLTFVKISKIALICNAEKGLKNYKFWNDIEIDMQVSKKATNRYALLVKSQNIGVDITESEPRKVLQEMRTANIIPLVVSGAGCGAGRWSLRRQEGRG